jgi:hypothetical protein
MRTLMLELDGPPRIPLYRNTVPDSILENASWTVFLNYASPMQ